MSVSWSRSLEAYDHTARELESTSMWAIIPPRIPEHMSDGADPVHWPPAAVAPLSWCVGSTVAPRFCGSCDVWNWRISHHSHHSASYHCSMRILWSVIQQQWQKQMFTFISCFFFKVIWSTSYQNGGLPVDFLPWVLEVFLWVYSWWISLPELIFFFRQTGLWGLKF